jgi:hypothetical protein
MSKIKWNRVDHVEAIITNENKDIGLKLKPIDNPLPKVTIITIVNDLILFQFAMYSWQTLVYPGYLLNWVIVDNKGILKNVNINNGDDRVRVVTSAYKKFDDVIKEVMGLAWWVSKTIHLTPLSLLRESDVDDEDDTPPALTSNDTLLRSRVGTTSSHEVAKNVAVGDTQLPDTSKSVAVGVTFSQDYSKVKDSAEVTQATSNLKDSVQSHLTSEDSKQAVTLSTTVEDSKQAVTLSTTVEDSKQAVTPSLTIEEDKPVVRPHHYMLMECGDIMFPDTLTLKHRALVLKKRDCVIPDGLAFYNIKENSSLVVKYFAKYPRHGMYWKKQWWNLKNPDKVVGLPYIGNCVTIGPVDIEGHVMPASVKFYQSFSNDIKAMIRVLVRAGAEDEDE